MPPTTPQADEPQPLKGQKKPVGHALWLKCTRCWEGPALWGHSDLLNAAENPFLQKDPKANTAPERPPPVGL